MLQQQLALEHRLPDHGIVLDLAQQFQLEGLARRRADEALQHLLQLAADQLALARPVGLVQDEPHLAALLLRRQDLDGGVRVRERGRFRRRDNQHVMRHRDGEQHHVGDARAGVQQHVVEARPHHLEDVQQLVPHVGREPRILHHARARQQHMEAAGRRQDGLVQGAALGEDVVQRELGMQVQHHIEIGQAEVGVQHQHALAARGQGRRQVGGDEGLAHAALAARDGQGASASAGLGCSRSCCHAHSLSCCVTANNMPFSSALTSESTWLSRQARLRPSALAR